MRAMALQAAERTPSDREFWTLPMVAEEWIKRTPSDQETYWTAPKATQIYIQAWLPIVCELGQALSPDLSELSTTIVCRRLPGSRDDLGSFTHDYAARLPEKRPVSVRITGTRVELDDLLQPRILCQVFRTDNELLFPMRTQQERDEAAPALPANPYADAIQWIKENTELPMDSIADLVNVSRVRLYNWKAGEGITAEHQRHLLAVRHILQRAAELHKTRDQLTAWLHTPRGADGRTPADLLKAGEFDRARLLAITAPSPGVKRPPQWVNEGGPRGVPIWREHMAEASMPSQDDELAESGEDQPEDRPKKSRITRRR